MDTNMAKKFFESITGSSSAGKSEKDLKKMYRRAAMKNHPDRGGDEETFKKLDKAYKILTGKEKPDKTYGGGTSYTSASSSWKKKWDAEADAWKAKQKPAWDKQKAGWAKEQAAQDKAWEKEWEKEWKEQEAKWAREDAKWAKEKADLDREWEDIQARARKREKEIDDAWNSDAWNSPKKKKVVTGYDRARAGVGTVGFLGATHGIFIGAKERQNKKTRNLANKRFRNMAIGAGLGLATDFFIGQAGGKNHGGGAGALAGATLGHALTTYGANRR